jgi:hypothetical protein
MSWLAACAPHPGMRRKPSPESRHFFVEAGLLLARLDFRTGFEMIPVVGVIGPVGSIARARTDQHPARGARLPRKSCENGSRPGSAPDLRP